MIGTYCSVKFFLNVRRQRSPEKMPLYLRIIIQGGKSELFLNTIIDPKIWDEHKQRVISKVKSDLHINHRLNEIEAQINDIIFDLEQKKETINTKVVVRLLTGKSVHSKNTVLKFINRFIDEAVAKGELSRVVIDQYRTMRLHLERYLKSTDRDDLYLAQLKRADLDGFEHYLLTYINPILQRAMNRNTSNKNLVRLKTVIKNAILKEVISKNPFDGFKIKNLKVEKSFLTAEELERLNKHDLNNNESLIRVRDFFMFSVYTGLRFSDAHSLRVDNIKFGSKNRLWILGHQKKTKDPIEIPMLDQAKVIYDKYENQRLSTGYILPRLHNQKVNNYLKEIMKLVGINKYVHHHVARHTFATTVLLENGVDIKTVSQFMGHQSVKSTEVYGKITKELMENVAKRIDGI